MSVCLGEWGSGHMTAQASEKSCHGTCPSLWAQGRSEWVAESPGLLASEHVSP